MSCVMLASFSIPALAASNNNEIITPQYVGTNTTHSWDYDVGTPTEKAKGSWTHFYTGDPAKRDGEYDTAQHSVSYAHTYSGSFGGDIKKLVQIELGISFTKSEEFSISKNSAPLKKGEYIKAYWIKNYDVYKVKQTDHQHTYGFEQQYPGGPYEEVDRYVNVVSYVDISKALQPKIRIEYWKDGTKLRSIDANDMPERVEYYEYVGGEYLLVYTETL